MSKRPITLNCLGRPIILLNLEVVSETFPFTNWTKRKRLIYVVKTMYRLPKVVWPISSYGLIQSITATAMAFMWCQHQRGGRTLLRLHTLTSLSPLKKSSTISAASWKSTLWTESQITGNNADFGMMCSMVIHTNVHMFTNHSAFHLFKALILRYVNSSTHSFKESNTVQGQWVSHISYSIFNFLSTIGIKWRRKRLIVTGRLQLLWWNSLSILQGVKVLSNSTSWCQGGVKSTISLCQEMFGNYYL